MATFYFNGAVDGEWTELGNWWMDDTFTTQATSLPTSADSVVATAYLTSNSGSEPTVANFTIFDPTATFTQSQIAITVTGIAIFNDTAWNSGTINGNAVFMSASANDNGTINGNATFNDSSYNSISGTVNGNANFNDSAFNNGTVTGDATFNNNSKNLYIVSGTAYYHDTAVSDSGQASRNVFTISAAISQMSYFHSGYELGSPEIVYEKGINGSSILGIV